jgi:hypothetical protein
VKDGERVEIEDESHEYEDVELGRGRIGRTRSVMICKDELIFYR